MERKEIPFPDWLKTEVTNILIIRKEHSKRTQITTENSNDEQTLQYKNTYLYLYYIIILYYLYVQIF
jgi:hypothetical protein